MKETSFVTFVPPTDLCSKRKVLEETVFLKN